VFQILQICNNVAPLVVQFLTGRKGNIQGQRFPSPPPQSPMILPRLRDRFLPGRRYVSRLHCAQRSVWRSPSLRIYSRIGPGRRAAEAPELESCHACLEAHTPCRGCASARARSDDNTRAVCTPLQPCRSAAPAHRKTARLSRTRPTL